MLSLKFDWYFLPESLQRMSRAGLQGFSCMFVTFVPSISTKNEIVAHTFQKILFLLKQLFSLVLTNGTFKKYSKKRKGVFLQAGFSLKFSPLMLSSLPPELLVQIFKNLPNFKAILALRNTDEIFARVWELNTKAILTAQTNSIRSRDDYVLENSDLGAYHILLQQTRRSLPDLNRWISSGF